MVKRGEKKGINVPWLVWARDDGTRDYEALLVAQGGGEVVKNPDKNPSLRGLVDSKLGPMY